MDDEQRLDALPSDWRSPALFLGAIAEFVREFHLTTTVFGAGAMLPALANDQRRSFKYGGEYFEVREELAKGGNLRVAVVQRNERVLGYGWAEVEDGDWEIKIIDVDQQARRKAGLQTALTASGQLFTVGVAHGLVRDLVGAIPRPVSADATSPGSRYAFKTLGFRNRPGAANPCLLILD